MKSILSRISILALLLACSGFSSASADELRYEFNRVVELTSENCVEGSNCLLQSYLSVALFADRKVANRQVGVLLEDYFYCHNGTGNVYRAPVGLETDFLSIPDLAQAAIRPKDFMEAGVVHDWLYAVGEPGKKEVADMIFHQILAEQGAGLAKREIMYRAVRWFGKSSYGAREEIPILDLETMTRITPSPIQRPVETVIANIDCGNRDEFERVRRAHRSNYRFAATTNQVFEHEGFVREEQ